MNAPGNPTSVPGPPSPEVLALLGDAAAFRLLGLLLESPCPPWREEVAALLAEASDPEVRRAAELALREATEGSYHTAFGPGGPAVAREVGYRRDVLPGLLMAEVAGYYDAFGYAPRIAEPPDHVAVEAGFLAYLRLKQAYALWTGDTEKAAVAEKAAADFGRDHLAATAAGLADSLAASGIEYLATAARALLGRTGPPPSARRQHAGPGCPGAAAAAGAFAVPEDSPCGTCGTPAGS